MDIQVHRLASDELEAAADRYAAEWAPLAEDFLREIARGIEAIATVPRAWPAVQGVGDPRIRRFVLGRFPFSIVYVIRADSIQIVAFAHARRRPGYWVDRLTS